MPARSTIALAIGLSLFAAAPAAAQSVDQDVRCLLLGNFFTKTEKDPAKRQLAQAASLYYLGRLDGRVSAAALRAQVQAQGSALRTQNVGVLMTACARQFGAWQQMASRAIAEAAKSVPAKK